MDLPWLFTSSASRYKLQQTARQANTPLTTTGDTGVPSGHGKLRGGGVNVSRDALLTSCDRTKHMTPSEHFQILDCDLRMLLEPAMERLTDTSDTSKI